MIDMTTWRWRDEAIWIFNQVPTHKTVILQSITIKIKRIGQKVKKGKVILELWSWLVIDLWSKDCVRLFELEIQYEIWLYEWSEAADCNLLWEAGGMLSNYRPFSNSFLIFRVWWRMKEGNPNNSKKISPNHQKICFARLCRASYCAELYSHIRVP